MLVTGAFDGAVWLLFATIGLILTLRRPGNPIGWLYAAAGLVWSLYVPWDPWVDQLLGTGRPLPLAAQLAALAGDSLWAVGITLAITLPLLLLPNGRLRSRRWRVVAVVAVAGTSIEVVSWALASQPMTQTLVPVAKPFALGGWAGTAAGTINWIGFGMLFASIPAAALCLVLRFRSSRGVERQQLRWVAAGATVAVVGPLLLIPLEAVGVLPRVDSFSWPLLLAVPLAIAVSVLRYRLWDLDRLVSRTVTYAVVTALLVVPYLLVVPAATRLVQGSGSLAVAAATLTVAALFSPCAAGSRTWSTGASTAAATTPPAPWTASRPASVTRSTWTRCTASCWPWSVRPCNLPRPRSGCANADRRACLRGIRGFWAVRRELAAEFPIGDDGPLC